MAGISDILSKGYSANYWVGQGSNALNLYNVGMSKYKAFMSKSVPKGLAGQDAKKNFIFDIPEGEKIRFENEITDYTTEGNTTVQNNVTSKPFYINLTGKVGDIVTKDPYSDVQNYFDSMQDLVGAFAPIAKIGQQVSQVGNQLIGYAKQTAQTVNQLRQQITQVIKGEPEERRQIVAFNRLVDMYENKELLTLTLFWRTVGNLMIESLEFEQDEKTFNQTTINLTLKQMTFVDLLDMNQGQLSGRSLEQLAKPTDKGNAGLESSFYVLGGRPAY